MNTFFVWTFWDLFDVLVIISMICSGITIILIRYIKERRCKHDGEIRETSSCDAICIKCGKNLGFIGKIRSDKIKNNE